jgi:MFS family permease
VSALADRPGVLAAPGYVRLWVAGGISGAMMWLEMLAAALFTLAATGSPLAVAVVSAARAAPLLLVGAVVGVAADAWDRRRIVLGGLLLTAASSASVALLAALGVLRPWHLAVAALLSGVVYATELPARRRLVVDLAGPDRVGRAVAIDSLTSFATRALGPVLGGVGVGLAGIGGAYGVSAACSLGAAALVLGVAHRQAPRALPWRRVGLELREGLAFARRARAVAMLLAVTTAMNLLGYPYTALVAPIGRGAGLSDGAIGLLAAAEPAGALCGGLLLVRLVLPGRPLAWLAGGAASLFGALAATWLAPPLWPMCGVLALGGLGVAAYTNMQTTIVMRVTPPHLRSRVFGLVSVCVGSWPIGQLLAGAVAEAVSPRAAMALLGAAGVMLLAVCAAAGRRTVSDG